VTSYIKLATFSTFVGLHDRSVHMHKEFAFFPSLGGYVEECYFVSTSIFIFYSKLVSFKKIVLRWNKLDSWSWLCLISIICLVLLLCFLFFFLRCPSSKRLSIYWCLFCAKLLRASPHIPCTIEIFVTWWVGTWRFDFWLINYRIALGCCLKRSIC